MDKFATLFERHSTHLSLEQISEGICACIDNALDIFGDAMVLLHCDRYARALSLLLTSLQEAGKVPLLRQMSLVHSSEQKKWNELWKSCRDHKIKDAFGHSVKINQDANDNPGKAFWQQII